MALTWSFKKSPQPISSLRHFIFGGARRDRTADLLNAIQALSQLSYGPKPRGKTMSALFDLSYLNLVHRRRNKNDDAI